MDLTTAIVTLCGLIATLLGGFAILGKAALRFFLGPKFDGKAGAWGQMVNAQNSSSSAIDQLRLDLHDHANNAEASAEHRHREIVEALKIVCAAKEKD